MKKSSFYNTINDPTSDSEFDDILWEYDFVHTTYQGECEDILLEMQRIFYEDLNAEEDTEGKFMSLVPNNFKLFQNCIIIGIDYDKNNAQLFLKALFVILIYFLAFYTGYH